MTFPPERHTTRGILLVIAGILAGLLIVSAFAFRAWQTATADRQLCNVLHRLVASSAATLGKPGTPLYAYYQDHPAELRVARARSQDALDQLDCDHLPSGGTP
jgi:hypothetical protein